MSSSSPFIPTQQMATTIYKPLVHKHPLSPSARFVNSMCGACHVSDIMYGGYFCNHPDCNYDSYYWFHKECVEAPLKINHPSHIQHPLLLSNDSRDGSCDLCGQKLVSPCYSCSTCEFKVDLICGRKPSPPAIEHPLCHDHPLVFLKRQEEENCCETCKESIPGPSYSCLECCNVYFHVGCVNFSKDINHPCHSNHPLELIDLDALTGDAETTCLLCEVQPKEKVRYHCSICNFTSCLHCTGNPPPLVVEDIKTHKHPLTRLSRRISCICDLCGEKGDAIPYICFRCDFVIHGNCIHLPHVTNINRHDHRISFTHHLGVGYSKCGVCRKALSRYHGAYVCSICPNYAVHTRCAVRSDVWFGVELEGIPDDTEDISPFKVVGDDLIIHFSHEKHLLRLHKDNNIYSKWLHCEACIHQIGFDPIYSCEECDFILHEKCANLPKKKRIVFGYRPYTLEVGTRYVNCNQCQTLCDGFKYISQDKLSSIDVHCGSLSEPFIHDSHLHPLYLQFNDGHLCDGCNNNVDAYVFTCDVCDFGLCFYCANLPRKIWHRNDEHPITLYCDDIASNINWCEICERELYPCKWFYTCSDCGVTFHARCVLGDFSRLKLEWFIRYGEKEFKVVINNHNTRPLCSQCHSRCKVSVILKDRYEDNEYICSRSCLMSC